jgi:hypothetical protein
MKTFSFWGACLLISFIALSPQPAQAVVGTPIQKNESALSRQDLEKELGRPLNFKEKIALKWAQRKLVKEARQEESNLDKKASIALHLQYLALGLFAAGGLITLFAGSMVPLAILAGLGFMLAIFGLVSNAILLKKQGNALSSKARSKIKAANFLGWMNVVTVASLLLGLLIVVLIISSISISF